MTQHIAVGLALLVILGGMLNLLGVATATTLTLVVIGGMLLAVGALRGNQMLKAGPLSRWQGLTLAWLALALGVALTQLQPSAFNVYDDFQKYFAHPVRMLQTGTLAGSPLSALGSETLGGQGFLHGFVVAYSSIHYLNGIDGVFGLILCLALAAEITFRHTRSQAMAVLAMLTVLLINPYYVNTSALYTGIALMLAAVGFTLDEAAEGERSWERDVLLGLLYAALVALKPTFTAFVAVHVALTALLRLSEGRGADTLRGLGIAGLSGAAALAPWILLHRAHYAVAFSTLRKATTLPERLDPTPDFGLFSTMPVMQGMTTAAYSSFALLIALAGLMVWIRNRPSRPARALLLLGLLAAGLHFALQLHGAALLSRTERMRYGLPVLIVAAALIVPVGLGTLLPASGPSRRKAILVSTALGVLVLLPTLPSTLRRWSQIVVHGNGLAFDHLATQPVYMDHVDAVLSPAGAGAIAQLQEKVPAGATLLAWINTPFYLDYRRNPIIDVDFAALRTPWSLVPSPEYVLLAHSGYPTQLDNQLEHIAATSANGGDRISAVHALTLRKQIHAWVQRGRVLHDADGILLFQLSPEDRPSPKGVDRPQGTF